MSFCRRRCSPNDVRHPPASRAWEHSLKPQEVSTHRPGGAEGGCDPCGALCTGATRGLWEETAPPRQGTRKQWDRERGQGSGHFPVCTKQETKNLPPPGTTRTSDQPCCYFQLHKHTQTQSHPRARKRPAHTHRQPRPQTTHAALARKPMLLIPRNCPHQRSRFS